MGYVSARGCVQRCFAGGGILFWLLPTKQLASDLDVLVEHRTCKPIMSVMHTAEITACVHDGMQHCEILLYSSKHFANILRQYSQISIVCKVSGGIHRPVPGAATCISGEG